MTLHLESPMLRAAGFRHGFSTRLVDLSLGSVGYATSLKRFAEAAGLPPERIVQVDQVHGAAVRVCALADVPTSPPYPPADALVSPRAGPAVGVRVADCVPLLIGDRDGGAVAAVHAGWRGFVAGVITTALGALEALATSPPPHAYVVAVGPCIGPCCFEVGADVAERIAEIGGQVITRRVGEKAFVDLRAGVRHVLEGRGIDRGAIEEVGACTHCDSERSFSYRRAAEKGRMLAAIAPHAA